MSDKETTLKPCPCCGANHWIESHTVDGYFECLGCGCQILTEEINNRPEEDRLKTEIDDLKILVVKFKDSSYSGWKNSDDAHLEIDRLKAENKALCIARACTESIVIERPHPTCETCENEPCHKMRVLQCSDSEGEYGMDVETDEIDYCSAHSALKDGDSCLKC